MFQRGDILLGRRLASIDVTVVRADLAVQGTCRTSWLTITLHAPGGEVSNRLHLQCAHFLRQNVQALVTFFLFLLLDGDFELLASPPSLSPLPSASMIWGKSDNSSVGAM